ncbi:MAG: M28 family peptidase [Clostridia bacterium]|nr:M28 family peptidase [Clostridia bacterium]
MKELLKRLSLAFGPSGCEDSVRAMIEKEIEPYIKNAEVIKDGVGNLIVHFNSEGKPRLMVSAHMDEIGFMVTGITQNGLLKFGAVGGFDPIVLSAKRVISESGVKGNIISKPIHLLTKEESEGAPKISNMSIDIGADSKKEAEALTFIGDYFTFDSDFVEYGEDLLKCKALDDRLGCAIMCQLIKDVSESKSEIPFDLYFSFSCKEEVGYSGAFGASAQIKPDYAIVIESKAVSDIFGVPDEKKVCTLGDGVIISFADKGAIYDRDLVRHIMRLCDENKIKYQTNKFISGGNDSANIQKNASGCRVSVLSAASRYIHSPADVISYSDFLTIYEASRAVIFTEIK